ncbi:MAG: ribonuclease H-like domain-containing protein [Candidatus Marinimicrobia bacterium]|nr:ribonuclease H-like domain-containing protein [Candidatus Neomarinimicrobiota bacterium]
MSFAEYLQGIGLGTFVSFDLETTGLDPKTDYVIEIGAVKVVNGIATERYQQFVKPPIRIPKFIEKLTGIDDEMVRNSPSFEDVVDDLYDFLGNHPLVAHNVYFDHNFLSVKRDLIDGYPLKNQLIDTLSLVRTVRYDMINHKLGTVAEFYGLSKEGAHRADYDADLVADILLILVSEMSRLSPDVLQVLISVLDGSDLPNEDLYRKMTEWTLTGKPLGKLEEYPQVELVQRPNIRHHDASKSYPELSEIFSASGLLSQKLEGYEPRETQVAMAMDIQRAMRNDEFFMAEAGTGVGKSLAYTIPAVITRHELNEDEPIFISCNTKNLQDQLFHKEIPFIQEQLDLPLRALLLKGRNNYLCKTKWQRAIRDVKWRFSRREKEALQMLVIWAHDTQTGDIDEHNGFNTIGNALVWSKLNSEPGFCTTNICAHNDFCYLGKLRQESAKADLVVVNHSLLLADAAADHAILPRYQRLIVDEAHLLEKTAYQFFASEFSYMSMRVLMDQLYYSGRNKSGLSTELRHMLMSQDEKKKQNIIQLLDQLESNVSEANNILLAFFTEFKESRQRELERATFTYKELYTKETDVFAPVKGIWFTVTSALNVLAKLARDVEKALDELDEDRISGLSEIISRIKSWREFMINTLAIMERQEQADDPDMIYWFEIMPVSEVVAVKFVQVPLEIGKQMQVRVYEDMASVIFTSGTLSVDGNFSYIQQRLGLRGHDRLQEKSYPSPFFYEDQARIFVPTFLGSQNSENYTIEVLFLLEKIWKTHPVGTMILFTSYTMLLNWQEELEDRIKGSGRHLLVQSSRVSRMDLINQFRRHPGSILLATDSFWQGVDLPGNALELLVIAKLPFSVPSDPIVRANSDALKRAGENDFMGYSVPEAAIKYKQGVGRLIRSTTDLGAIISLDERIFTKRYGDYFRNSTPIPHVPANSEKELVEMVRAWYRSHGVPEVN